MVNYIIIAVLVLIIGTVVFYLVREKKRGVTCVGCPYAKQCAKRHGGQCGGSCSHSKK